MYRKSDNGILKHWDFMLLDMLCLQIAFFAAYILSSNGSNPYYLPLYRSVAVFIELADVAILAFFSSLKNVLKRGYYREMLMTLRHTVLLALVTVFYLFVIHKGGYYSRLAFGYMTAIYLVLSYAVRVLWKKYLKNGRVNSRKRSLLIITDSQIAEEVVENVVKLNYAGFIINGIAYTDRKYDTAHVNAAATEDLDGIRVVADADSAAEYVLREWVDEVLIVLTDDEDYPRELIEQLEETGVVVHVNLKHIDSVPGKKQFVEKIGSYTVLTTSINYASASQLLLKRMMDICGGLVGCAIMALLCIVVGPAIYINSPGPIFFTQERVGKSGRKFKMYKFRSMYMDAEARKQELMKYNKLGDGKMFKLDFDPRIIGNRILPDGTHKTGVGAWMRSWSIDEFPQFINVLKGDMSIVGTRPPLVSETNLYELRHRARLAVKPGITGLWQISGRSNILDFEEVVRLDKEYISTWNIGLDIKIIIMTVFAVLRKSGAE